MTTTLNASTAGAGGFIATSDNSGVLALQTGGTTAITVDTSQNVGIGGTGYTEKLTVNGAIVSKGTATANQTSAIALDGTYASSISAIRAWGASGTTASIAFLTGSGGSNDAERMRIDTSGNLNIASSASNGAYVNIWCGDNSRNGLNIQVFSNGNNAVGFKNVSGSQVGSITVNASTTAYNTSSDYRLKENIAPMTGALAKVTQLKPVTYKWKIDGSDGEGFIAHELAEVCSHAVSGAKDAIDENGNPEYQGIDVSFLVATLTAAIQELKAINDTQAETINALTARIVALEQA